MRKANEVKTPMKAEVTNTFDVGEFTLTLTTALFARKVNGVWKVHLNYHKLTIRYLDTVPQREIPMLDGQGLSIQTSRDNDWISGVSLILGSIGIIAEVVKLIRNVMEVLADVSSLLPKVSEWVSSQLVSTDAQEPTYRTLRNTYFVLQLMRDGVHIERRLPRWRRKLRSEM